MKNFILASTSTVHGSSYLEYLKAEIAELFEGINEILFIPYARPSGMTHDEYTKIAADFFSGLNMTVKGLHSFESPDEAIKNAKGIFTGGGNTFLLVKQLHDHKLMDVLKETINSGTPYLGTSAGSNIAGINMKTTNDMPIVYPSDFKTMGLIPFNLNPHYLDPDPDSKHKGETRETRILEFLTQNNTTVLGLREGNWICGIEDEFTVKGPHTTRVFKANESPFEINSGADLNQL